MRRYGQDCPLARALDLMGDRWTLLIIRELLLGERHYNELSEALKGMGTNLLATRLQELTAQGIVRKDPEAGRKAAYQLAERGEALRTAVYELIRWEYLETDRGAEAEDVKNPRWQLLLLQALVRRPPPKRFTVTVNLAMGDHRFEIQCQNGSVTIKLGHDPEETNRVRASKATFSNLCQSPSQSFKKAVQSLEIEGDKKRIEVVLRLFPMS